MHPFVTPGIGCFEVLLLRRSCFVSLDLLTRKGLEVQKWSKSSLKAMRFKWKCCKRVPGVSISAAFLEVFRASS